MCGIIGLIDKNKNTPKEILSDMIETLHHRGPDDVGVFYEQNTNTTIGLGHKRLSIQDLSNHGHQPMSSDCENYIIVFNGEVYNFKEIKKELEEFGYKFNSNSDTEVVLYSYKQWGIKAVDRFIGMFAFCIYDKDKDEIVLVRDRFGVKPLHYYLDESIFMFSSELKAFHKHPIFKENKKIDLESLSLYFQFGYINAPKTIFKNTYKLEPGKYLTYNLKLNTIDIQTYWDVKDSFNQKKTEKTEEEILEDLEKLLIDSYKLRMVSDVPVGVFLSGGYDSVSVASILQKHTDQKIKTFTIGFDEEKYNEAKYAKEIANYLGTEHKELYITEEDLLEILPTLTDIYDEPFGDSSAIPTIAVSKLAGEDVKVVLSGDGGDETFFGYGKYINTLKLQKIYEKYDFLKYFDFKFLDDKFLYSLLNFLPYKYKSKNLISKILKLLKFSKIKSITELYSQTNKYFLSEETKRLQRISINQSKQDDVSMQYIDFKTYLPDDILQKVDRASMSESIEAREPLLDHRIIEYVGSIPEELIYKNKIQKYLLKEIVHKYVPKELMDREKQGFSIPIDKWLNGKLKDEVYFYLDYERVKQEGLLNPEEVVFLRDSYYKKRGVNPYKIWFLFVFEKWYERWIDGK
ncbi:asparagine synthase (glutamine-hydrolyzing) [Aliarcobacter butzleri]